MENTLLAVYIRSELHLRHEEARKIPLSAESAADDRADQQTQYSFFDGAFYIFKLGGNPSCFEFFY